MMRSMSSLRILVTGASGFVGGAYARYLRARGHTVVGTVNSRAGAPGDVVVDVRRRDAWDAVPAGDFDVVVHAAAKISQARIDRATRETNVGGTRNAIDFARTRGCAHFVHVSSTSVYGHRSLGENRVESTAISASRDVAFETEYQRSKAEAERVVARSGVPFTSLRLPLVIGAGSSFAAPALLPLLDARSAPYTIRNDRRISVVCAGNLGPMLDAVLAHGPAGRAFNACDHHLPWKDFIELYAATLGKRVEWEKRPVTDWIRYLGDPVQLFWLGTGLFGAHYPSDALEAARPYRREQTLEEAVREEVTAAGRAVAPRSESAARPG